MRRAFLAGLFALTACASTDAAGPRTYSGIWDFHFETSAFVTDAGQGPHWLASEGDTWSALTAPLAQTGSPWGRVHVIVEGKLSAPGQYGHLGAYSHELRVTRVIESRLASDRPSNN